MKLEDVILRDTRANQPAATTVPAGTLYFVTDETVTERSTGAAWQSYTDVGSASVGSLLDVVFVRKTGNESVTSSAVSQDDDDLLFSIGASEVWEAQFVLFVKGSNAGDIRTQITVPSGATATIGNFALQSTTTGGAGTVSMNASADATDLGWGVNDTTNAVMGVLRALIVNGATPGTVQLKWGQLVSNGTATVVQAGSYLIATRFV